MCVCVRARVCVCADVCVLMCVCVCVQLLVLGAWSFLTSSASKQNNNKQTEEKVCAAVRAKNRNEKNRTKLLSPTPSLLLLSLAPLLALLRMVVVLLALTRQHGGRLALLSARRAARQLERRHLSQVTRIDIDSTAVHENLAFETWSVFVCFGVWVLLLFAADLVRPLALHRFALPFHQRFHNNTDLTQQSAILFWKNDPCVVVGSHQNPWLECDLEAMQQDSIALARRNSGGGTVFHVSLSRLSITQTTHRRTHTRARALSQLLTCCVVAPSFLPSFLPSFIFLKG